MLAGKVDIKCSSFPFFREYKDFPMMLFYNLATNAFKAMPGGGKLTIRLAAHNGGARIQFEDTGMGMEEEELKKLFVPFHSAFRNGTGLGLPIVYQIVTAHNGSIAVNSRRGVGSVFSIDL